MLVSRSISEQHERRLLELNGDLGMSLGQPLPSPKVKRHPRPSPVIDVEFKRDEGLCLRLRRDAWLRAIPADLLGANCSVSILSSHAVMQNVFRDQGLHSM